MPFDPVHEAHGEYERRVHQTPAAARKAREDRETEDAARRAAAEAEKSRRIDSGARVQTLPIHPPESSLQRSYTAPAIPTAPMYHGRPLPATSGTASAENPELRQDHLARVTEQRPGVETLGTATPVSELARYQAALPGLLEKARKNKFNPDPEDEIRKFEEERRKQLALAQEQSRPLLIYMEGLQKLQAGTGKQPPIEDVPTFEYRETTDSSSGHHGAELAHRNNPSSAPQHVEQSGSSHKRAEISPSAGAGSKARKPKSRKQ